MPDQLEQYDWTIMVYMAGDNNLSENMAFSLKELELSPEITRAIDRDEAKVNVLAYFDSSALTAPTHYFDFSVSPPIRKQFSEENRIYPKNRQNRVWPSVNRETAEDDSASAHSILNFVHWCLKTQKRTASNYALVFSGHSEAFKDTTLLQDDSAGHNMSLWKFRWAMETILKDLLGGEKIDILGFDSCLMSMLEVGYELKDVAKTIVASEGSIPNSGWGYARLLTEFIADFPQIKDDNVTDVYVKEGARSLVRSFTEHYKGLSIGGRSVDISSWDLNEINPVATGVNELAIELNAHLDLVNKVQVNELTDTDIRVYQELRKVILQSHFDAQTYMKEQSVDIKDFCKRLILESKFMLSGPHSGVFDAIIKKSENVIKAVDNCVLRCGYSGEEYQYSNGISIYFPWTLLTLSLTNFNYRYLKFNKGDADDSRHENPQGIGKDWSKFLINYLSRVTLRRTRKELGDKVSMIEDSNVNNPIFNTDLWSRDNPRWSRDNPRWSRDNPRWSRDNPRLNRGETGNSTFYFGKFKNFQLSWTIAGYADESEFPKDP